MAKTKAKTSTSKRTLKKTSKKPERARSTKKPRPPRTEPSWIRGDITARRMGRPPKLTRALIAEFLGHLKTGLHLQNCAALVGVAPQMAGAWLRDGRNDEDRGKASIAREFSSAVRATLAELQRQGITTLAVYQRMAEGWDPRCARCTKERGPCGAHPKMLKLAADLQKWTLQHRFPREWSPGTVPALLAGDQDAAAGGGTPSPEGAPAAAVFGALVFLPPRRPDDLE